MSRSRASASAAPGLVAFAALAVLRACSAQATTLDALQARLDALTPPPCGSGSYLIYTNGAWTCSPAQACAAPPACAPPGGARLLYDTTTGWFCECTSGWSGASCSVFNATAAAPSTQVLLQSIQAELSQLANSLLTTGGFGGSNSLCSPIDDPVQCAALVALVRATTYKTYVALSSNMGSTYCSWLGITCGGTSGADVVAITIPYGNVIASLTAGHLPDELGNLTSLTSLSIKSGGLTGSLPTTLASLTSLVNLDLSNNKLSGTIPSSFTRLSALTYLDLSGNKLAGDIPNFTQSSLTSCAQLQAYIGNSQNFMYSGLQPGYYQRIGSACCPLTQQYNSGLNQAGSGCGFSTTYASSTIAPAMPVIGCTNFYSMYTMSGSIQLQYCMSCQCSSA